MPVVTPSHLPAPRPSPAMAGVMRAKMRTGTKNPRKPPKRLLKVAEIRASQSGKKRLHTMPRMIARITRNSRDEVRRFRSMPGIYPRRVRLLGYDRHRCDSARPRRGPAAFRRALLGAE